MQDHHHQPIPVRQGIAKLTRKAYRGENLAADISKIMQQLALWPDDPGALLDLSFIEQLKGNVDGGLKLQASALETSQVFRTAGNRAAKTTLLVICAPVQMGANTPVEFLLEGSTVDLTTLFVSPDHPLPDPLPSHDLAFVAAPGDTDAKRQHLSAIEKLTRTWPRPLLNAPVHIRKLERDRLHDLLAGTPGLAMPWVKRLTRAQLQEFSTNPGKLRIPGSNYQFPLVVRPVGAHAGRNLERIERPEDFGSYLKSCSDPEFFLSDFLDYRSKDGLFRKYRIVFVAGQPFACHMAIADQWKVWYLNANMAGSHAKRQEEEAFMANFETEFAKRHSKSFRTITNRLQLDYFGIDCAEDRHGNLVLFEADNALIVHDMDCEKTFPYKRPAMRKLFGAFEEMIHTTSQGKRGFAAPDAAKIDEAITPGKLTLTTETHP